MTRVLVDVLGWIGAGALLSAYALVSAGRLSGRGLGFQLLNLLGAVGLLVNGVYHGAWPSAGHNTVWLVLRGHSDTSRTPRPTIPPPQHRTQ